MSEHEPDVTKELEAVKDYCRRVGFRWTKQRALIVEHAFLTHSHFSAESLCDMIKGRAGSDATHLATIYRTLQVLEEGQFIEALDIGGKGGRLFEHVLGHDHHDHVICSDCGKIVEFHDDELEFMKRRVADRAGFAIQAHNLKIYGKCKKLHDGGHCEEYVRRQAQRQTGSED